MNAPESSITAPPPTAEIEEVALSLSSSPVPKEEEEVLDDDGRKRRILLPPPPLPSHFKNDIVHSIWIRYGVPIYLFGTFLLLLNSDIGSGVTAEYILLQEEDRFNTQDVTVVEQKQLFEATIFSSVKELWWNGSYPLAILIAITSIAWPYIKLLLCFYVWMTPPLSAPTPSAPTTPTPPPTTTTTTTSTTTTTTTPVGGVALLLLRKRELLLEILDMIGKWSFVDIIVLVEILVAFRSTIILSPQVKLEIVIVPQWGFYGFVVATMLSLLATHFILYCHRKVMYPPPPPHHLDGHTTIENDNPKTQQCLEEAEVEETGDGTAEVVGKGSNENNNNNNNNANESIQVKAGLSTSIYVVSLLLLLIGGVFYLLGYIFDIYEVKNTRGTTEFIDVYSIAKVGKDIPPSSLDSSDIGIRFLQVMWFILTIIMPLICSCLWGIFFCIPNLSTKLRHVIFIMAEISFSWSCAEVLFISTIFSVLQLPTFGDGLIESDCQFCFSVDSNILLFPNFLFLTIGTILNVFGNIWFYRKAHKVLYQQQEPQQPQEQKPQEPQEPQEQEPQQVVSM